MTARMILTGDVILTHVEDPSVPFGRVRDVFGDALLLSNLGCCPYSPPARHSFHNESFVPDPAVGGEALRQAGITAVGIANTVNDGDPAASIQRLDALGIAHTGAGATLAECAAA